MAETAENAHPETCPSLCVERSHPGREHDETTDGCHCWELCAMGPTCPGANAGLPRGCWRVASPDTPDPAVTEGDDSCDGCGHEKAKHRDDGCYFSGSKASCRCAFRGGR